MAQPKVKPQQHNAVLIWDNTLKEYKVWDGVLATGDIEIGAVEIKNATSDDRATVDTSGRVYVLNEGLSGNTTDGTTALVAANTWYAVPSASVPTSDYCLVVSKENEAGTIRWSFDNGGTPSATNGNKMSQSDMVFELGGSQVVYFGSSNAGDDVNFTTKII